MKSKRTYQVICISLIVALFLCACGDFSDSSALEAESSEAQTTDAGLWDYLDTYIVSPDATILTLQCWAPDQYLQTCVQNYNLTHDDVQIKIEAAFENYSDTQSAQAAMDQLNLKLLAGDTPDIFCFNSLNIMALENANLVLDLREYMENDDAFQADDYYMNIWEQFSLHGKLYEFIPAFELIGLAGQTSEIGARDGWSFEEWLAFSQSHSDKPMLNLTSTAMLEYMEMYSLSAFVDVENASCNFETDSFYQFLEIISQMPTQNTGSESILNIARIDSVYDYLFMNGRTEQTITGFPSSDGNGPSIHASYSYGICSKTAYPEECWDFLMFLLDEQNADNLTSFSMRKSVNEALFAQAQLPADDPDSLVYQCYDENDTQIQPLAQEEVDYLKSLLATADSIRFRYADVESIVSEEVPAYLNTDKTAEDVAALIQSRVSIFLAEQQ
jgi:ABC-type glycerol-3-phosphate transport system substrate-binding protein